MRTTKQILIAIAIWIILFVTLTPLSLRDGHSFDWQEPWTWAFASALAILIWAFRHLIQEVRGPHESSEKRLRDVDGQSGLVDEEKARRPSF